MEHDKPQARREVRQCVCGQKIVLQAGDSQNGEGELRVVAIRTESGATIRQCPRCGIEVADR